MLFVGCDPDTRNMAYAVLDSKCNVLDAYVIKSKGDPFEMARNIEEEYKWASLGLHLFCIEGQQIYAGKNINPANILKLAQFTGLALQKAAQYAASAEIVLPKTWKGTVAKHIHQARIVTQMGLTPETHGSGANAYTVPAEGLLGLKVTELKHVIDAVGIAMWARDRFHRENRKRELLGR